MQELILILPKVTLAKTNATNAKTSKAGANGDGIYRAPKQQIQDPQKQNPPTYKKNIGTLPVTKNFQGNCQIGTYVEIAQLCAKIKHNTKKLNPPPAISNPG